MVLPHNIYYYFLNLEHVFEVLKILLARKFNMISSDQVLCFSQKGKGENRSKQVLYTFMYSSMFSGAFFGVDRKSFSRD